MIDNDGWNAIYLENHDQSRTVSRFCTDTPQYLAPAAKMLATFMALQSGTLFIYQGQELGMVNIPKTASWTIGDYRDLETLNHWHELLNTPAGDHDVEEKRQAEAQAEYLKKSRDNSRTPMQWDASAHAGFTSGSSQPWIKINPSYQTGLHAANQLEDPDSPYRYWSRLLALRKKYPDIFVYGDFKIDDNDDDEEVLRYERIGDSGERVVVLCNWTEKNGIERTVEAGMKILEGSYGVNTVGIENGGGSDGRVVVRFRPWEAIVGIWRY